MTCRPAGCSDIPGLIRLRLAFLAELHGPLAEEESASFSAVLEDYFRRCLGKTLLCYLAEVDGAAVAAAMLCIAEKPASRNTPTGVFGTVYSVYTQPAFRRRGISAALMRGSSSRRSPKPGDGLRKEYEEMKKLLKIALIVLAVPLCAALALVIWLTVTEYRPAAVEPAALDAAAADRTLAADGTLSLLTFNVGYGGLGKSADFFMPRCRATATCLRCTMPSTWPRARCASASIASP